MNCFRKSSDNVAKFFVVPKKISPGQFANFGNLE